MPHRATELTQHSGRGCKPATKIGAVVNGICTKVDDPPIITQTVKYGIIACRGARAGAQLVRMFEVRLGSQNAPPGSGNLNGDTFDSTEARATFQITQGRGTAEKVVVTLGA